MRDRNARSIAAVERLKRRSDFRAAATGMRASSGAFVLQVRRRPDDGAVRVGFTVSKQVGNAVERNRVRRRLREIAKLSAVAAAAAGTTDGLRPGHDYVLIGRRAALATPFGDMMKGLDAALSRIHTLERGGTGGTPHGPLHEAGSPFRPQQPRRSRKSRKKLPDHPPREH